MFRSKVLPIPLVLAKYCSSLPVYTAVLPPVVLQALTKRTLQYTSHVHRNVRAYGSHLFGNSFENVLGFGAFVHLENPNLIE